MDITYKKIDKSQLDELVTLRMKVLRAANKLSEDVDMSEIEKQSYKYYEQGFDSGNFTIFFAMEGKKVVGCGGVSYFDVMPTFDFPNGKCAYIMNMYTEPEFRKNGIATKILDLLVSECKSKEIHKITLEATDMGRSVYEKYGFVQMKHEMELLYV